MYCMFKGIENVSQPTVKGQGGWESDFSHFSSNWEEYIHMIADFDVSGVGYPVYSMYIQEMSYLIVLEMKKEQRYDIR